MARMGNSGWMKVLLALVLPLAAQAPAQAQADKWPTGPVKLLVGYAAGGSTDLAARTVAEHLTQRLGQPVIVENRAGAGGTISAAAVAKAESSGHTLLFAGSPELTISRVTRKELPYDSLKDFQPVTLVGTAPFILVAGPSTPATDLRGFIAWAKAQNGKASFGSYGANTSPHLIGELFKSRAGFEATHIPYKGSAPALTDIMGGQINYMLDTPTGVVPLVASGRLKAIATATSARWPQLPDVPTMSEAGLPGFVYGSWYGLLAPAGTPRAVVELLQREVSAILKTPDVRKLFESRGVEAGGGSSQEFAQLISTEIGNWQTLAAKLGIKPE